MNKTRLSPELAIAGSRIEFNTHLEGKKRDITIFYSHVYISRSIVFSFCACFIRKDIYHDMFVWCRY